jgi:hypothetical protein
MANKERKKMMEKKYVCGWKENSKCQQWCFEVVAVERKEEIESNFNPVFC